MKNDRNNKFKPARHERPTSSSRSDMSMMRIAVAGTGGLAINIARCIQETTAHQVVILSRTTQNQLRAAGYQVAVVEYENLQSTTFALRGVDTVVSTVTGSAQMDLIRAAVAAGVRRFAAAEFEGIPQLRPQNDPNDPLDRRRSQAWQLLQSASQRIQSTSFICGILYERFQPGGLQQSRIGMTSGFSREGDYMLDCRNMSAKVPAYDANNNPTVTMCLTSACDVARFVTKAIDLPQWPPELRMCGLRITVQDLVALIQRLKRRAFDPIQGHNPSSLRSELQVAEARQDSARIIRLHTLIATAEGRYDFTLTDTSRSLNHRFPEIRPKPFQEWFAEKWNLSP